MTPKCPGCKQVVEVTRATFLMADHSAPQPIAPKAAMPKV
jgi:hypothetical protein